MRKGTTPTNVFTTDQDLSDADVVYITYKQKNTVMVEKDKDDITFASDSDTYTMTVRLTQAETLSFNELPIEIQIRARWADGTAIASNIVSTNAKEVLKDGVI